jgi:hypothetical protein
MTTGSTNTFSHSRSRLTEEDHFTNNVIIKFPYLKGNSKYFDIIRNPQQQYVTNSALNKCSMLEAKIKLSLCFFLTEHHAMKAYCGVEE